jgi:hypothetical protein
MLGLGTPWRSRLTSAGLLPSASTLTAQPYCIGKEQMMRCKHLLITCTVLLLALVVLAPGVALGKAHGFDRPITGAFSQTATLDVATGSGTSEGTGIFSHLGKITLVSNGSGTITGSTINFTGTSTLSAANGDQLFGTYIGTEQLSSIPAAGQVNELTLVLTITGGTGRFADASGTLTIDIHQEIVSFDGATALSHDTGTVRGRISYSAGHWRWGPCIPIRGHDDRDRCCRQAPRAIGVHDRRSRPWRCCR